jgi:predicted DNA-binding transcriptional regulator AlpA
MDKAAPPMGASQPPVLLTLALIRQHYFPVGERTIFRLIASGVFPKADIRMGGKLRLWKRETVEAWITKRSDGEQALSR